MASNGNGRDYLLMWRMFHSRKFVSICETDRELLKVIKGKINKTIALATETIWTGTNYNIDFYRAWKLISNTNTVINKLRQQNWYWDEIKTNSYGK